MKHPFTGLTLQDVEILRKKRSSVSSSVGSISYTFTLSDIINAQKHLETLYPSGKVYLTFAERILLLNSIY